MGFFDFLRDASSETRAIRKGFNFIKKPAVGAGRTVKNVVRYGPESVGEATVDVGRGVRDFSVGAARSIPRSIVRTGGEAGMRLSGEEPSDYVGRPEGRLADIVLGKEPVESFSKLGRDTGVRGAGGTALGIGFTALDLTPGGKAKREAGEQVIKRLMKETTEAGVKKVLKGQVDDVLIDQVAPAIAKTKDPNIVKNLLKKASGVTDEAPSMLPARPGAGQDIVSATVGKAPQVGKTVDEGKVFYHGTNNKDLKSIADLKAGRSLGKSSTNMTYVTENPEIAKNFGDNVVSSKVYGKHLDISKLGNNAWDDISVPEDFADYKTTKMLSERSKRVFEQQYLRGQGDNRIIDATPEIHKYLKSKGYSTVTVPRVGSDVSGARTETILIDQNALKPSVSGEVIPPASENPFDDILGAIHGKPAAPGQAPVKGIKGARAEQTALLKKERGERFRASKSAGEQAEGSPGYFAEKSKLKGEYSKVEYNTLLDDIGPERAEELFSSARRQVQSVPDETYRKLGLHPQAARLNTQTAVRKVIGLEPGLPTPSEIKLLEVVSPQLAEQAKSAIPKQRQLFDFAAKLAGLPRAIKSSFDFSMGGRQGLFVAARHPVQWAKANAASVKFAKDSGYYDEVMDGIRQSDEYLVGDKYGLSLPAAKHGREEAYAAADLAEKIPTVKRFERAYNGGLTKLRYDLWKQHMDSLGGITKAEQDLGDKGMRGLAEAINTLTGRGGKQGGFLAKNAQALSTTLFSPRLWASRLNNFNPAYWARLGPEGRKVALENMGSFAALAGVVLGAAAMSGAEVETDARSADFLKIKVGDTRYDVLGGFQQNLVFAWREISGETKSTQSENISKVGEGFGSPTRLSFLGDLARNKLNPIVGTTATLLEGEDRVGNKINPAVEIGKLFIPINMEGAYETIKNEGSIPKGLALNAPNFVGVGTQTYGVKDIKVSEKQDAYLKVLKNKGAPKQQIEASKSFFQSLKTGPNRNDTSAEINEALASGDKDKAVQIAKEYNKKLSEQLNGWREKYPEYRKDETLIKTYNSAQIRLTNSSINQRLRNIKTNPLYDATIGK